MPGGFRLEQERFNDGWMRAGDISTAGLDWALRGAGWRLLWIEKASRGLGFGRSEFAALSHATARALNRIGDRFNAAEVDSVRMSGFPWFRIVRVTAHPRQILEQASPGATGPVTIRQIFGR